MDREVIDRERIMRVHRISRGEPLENASIDGCGSTLFHVGRIPRGPSAGLLSHGVRGECRGEKLHRWKGRLVRHLRTFSNFLFLSFLFYPFRLNGFKGTRLSCSFFWGRGFLLFTDEFVGIEISEEKEEVRFSIEAFHFRGRGDERSNF